MFKVQVYTINNEWKTVCETNDKYLNDIANALLEKFKSRSFRVLNEDDTVLWNDLYKEVY